MQAQTDLLVHDQPQPTQGRPGSGDHLTCMPMQTDIKEAVFMGDADELVAAGSDLGHVFIYRAATGEVGCLLDIACDICAWPKKSICSKELSAELACPSTWSVLPAFGVCSAAKMGDSRMSWSRSVAKKFTTPFMRSTQLAMQLSILAARCIATVHAA